MFATDSTMYLLRNQSTIMNKHLSPPILVYILILFFNYSSLYAQFAVTGRVLDENKQPLQGCTVLFMQADSLIGGSITNKKGIFELNKLPEGIYTCKISMLGFETLEHVFSMTKNIQLHTLILKENATLLEEVKVMGDRRTIIHTGAGTTTFFLSEKAKKSKNAIEALAEIPKLRINPINRSIALSNGKTPLILIDGINRQDYMNVLNPEIIESVEIIENPSARYLEQEGITAILNIKLRREIIKPYINGNVGANYKTDLKFGVHDVSFDAGNATSSLYFIGQYWFFNDDLIKSGSESRSGNIFRSSIGESNTDIQSFYATLGGDKIFSDKNYVAFSLKYVGNPNETEYVNEGSVEEQLKGKKSLLSVEGDNKNSYHLLAGDFYYKHSFNKKQSIDFSTNYSYSYSGLDGVRDEKSELYNYTNSIRFKNDRHSGIIKMNYINQLKDKWTFNVGLKTSYANTSIDDKLDNFTVFAYKQWDEYIYTGIDNNRSSDKFKYALSLGGAIALTDADGVKNKNVDFIPVVSLSYIFNQKHAVTFSYNRNRTTPAASYMNPRNTSTDSLYMSQGNPYLTPVFRDVLHVDYRFNYKKINLEPFVEYQYISDLISPIGYVKDNIYVRTLENVDNQSLLQLGTSLGYSLPFGNMSLRGYYQKDYIKGMLYEGDSWGVSLSTFLYYKNVNIYISGNYLSAYYSLTSKGKGGVNSNFNFSWNISNLWRLSFSWENLLFYNMASKTWVKDKDYNSYSYMHYVSKSPKIMFGITYTFKNKIVKKWRNVKKFYENDNELQKINVN